MNTNLSKQRFSRRAPKHPAKLIPNMIPPTIIRASDM